MLPQLPMYYYRSYDCYKNNHSIFCVCYISTGTTAIIIIMYYWHTVVVFLCGCHLSWRQMAQLILLPHIIHHCCQECHHHHQPSRQLTAKIATTITALLPLPAQLIMLTTLMLLLPLLPLPQLLFLPLVVQHSYCCCTMVTAATATVIGCLVLVLEPKKLLLPQPW